MPLSAPEPLTERHDLSSFSSGKPALDNWLKQRALSNQQKSFSAVVVVCDGARVVGYYALAPAALSPASFPRSVRTGQPPNPQPCILLGQMAVDSFWSDQGIGMSLLRHAYGRAVDAAMLIGGRVLLVNAVDDEAYAFWQRRGFLPTRDSVNTLYLPISDVARTIGRG
ncbi:MAG TPA: GNAT family N-acetyltransferase [Rhizomicrobium sp.]|jgi:GNAT superfamily N-acetyltransferase|nr:GNAT family N-acetyltransferase [Rhizomicrobium sp.]